MYDCLIYFNSKFGKTRKLRNIGNYIAYFIILQCVAWIAIAITAIAMNETLYVGDYVARAFRYTYLNSRSAADSPLSVKPYSFQIICWLYLVLTLLWLLIDIALLIELGKRRLDPRKHIYNIWVFYIWIMSIIDLIIFLVFVIDYYKIPTKPASLTQQAFKSPTKIKILKPGQDDKLIDALENVNFDNLDANALGIQLEGVEGIDDVDSDMDIFHHAEYGKNKGDSSWFSWLDLSKITDPISAFFTSLYAFVESSIYRARTAFRNTVWWIYDTFVNIKEKIFARFSLPKNFFEEKLNVLNEMYKFVTGEDLINPADDESIIATKFRVLTGPIRWFIDHLVPIGWKIIGPFIWPVEGIIGLPLYIIDRIRSWAGWIAEYIMDIINLFLDEIEDLFYSMHQFFIEYPLLTAHAIWDWGFDLTNIVLEPIRHIGENLANLPTAKEAFGFRLLKGKSTFDLITPFIKLFTYKSNPDNSYKTISHHISDLLKAVNNLKNPTDDILKIINISLNEIPKYVNNSIVTTYKYQMKNIQKLIIDLPNEIKNYINENKIDENLLEATINSLTLDVAKLLITLPKMQYISENITNITTNSEKVIQNTERMYDTIILPISKNFNSLYDLITLIDPFVNNLDSVINYLPKNISLVVSGELNTKMITYIIKPLNKSIETLKITINETKSNLTEVKNIFQNKIPLRTDPNLNLLKWTAILNSINNIFNTLKNMFNTILETPENLITYIKLANMLIPNNPKENFIESLFVNIREVVKYLWNLISLYTKNLSAQIVEIFKNIQSIAETTLDSNESIKILVNIFKTSTDPKQNSSKTNYSEDQPKFKTYSMSLNLFQNIANIFQTESEVKYEIYNSMKDTINSVITYLSNNFYDYWNSFIEMLQSKVISMNQKTIENIVYDKVTSQFLNILNFENPAHQQFEDDKKSTNNNSLLDFKNLLNIINNPVERTLKGTFSIIDTFSNILGKTSEMFSVKKFHVTLENVFDNLWNRLVKNVTNISDSIKWIFGNIFDIKDYLWDTLIQHENKENKEKIELLDLENETINSIIPLSSTSKIISTIKPSLTSKKFKTLLKSNETETDIIIKNISFRDTYSRKSDFTRSLLMDEKTLTWYKKCLYPEKALIIVLVTVGRGGIIWMLNIGLSIYFYHLHRD